MFLQFLKVISVFIVGFVFWQFETIGQGIAVGFMMVFLYMIADMMEYNNKIE